MTELSSFSIGNPQFLPAILLILPALFFVGAKFKKIERNLSASQNQKTLSSLKISLFLRTLFRSLAWVCAVLALCEISFGSKKIPVHKSGSNVSFVFDISYSMLAKDAPSRLTRLDAVKLYASSLIEHLSGSSFSAVLAKGDGFTAIPETEDAAAMLNLLENLSPTLMSSGGSSLGKGIEAALNAIPKNSAKSEYIWVFTDGDETDSRLEKSLELAAKAQIPVTLVGFGSEKESEITAGDGKTRVKTALRAQKMKEIADSVNSKAASLSFSAQKPRVGYVDSKSQGSAWQLLNQITRTAGEDEESTLAYEVKQVNRHAFFIFWAVVFLILSFVAAEFKLAPLKNKHFRSILEKSLVFAAVFLFASCSSEKKQILEGAWAWYEGKYTTATADFLTVAHRAGEDSLAQTDAGEPAADAPECVTGLFFAQEEPADEADAQEDAVSDAAAQDEAADEEESAPARGMAAIGAADALRLALNEQGNALQFAQAADVLAADAGADVRGAAEGTDGQESLQEPELLASALQSTEAFFVAIEQVRNAQDAQADSEAEAEVGTAAEIEAFSWGDDPARVDYGALYENRAKVLKIAYERFSERLKK
mgnify:CR=1 FL=1